MGVRGVLSRHVRTRWPRLYEGSKDRCLAAQGEGRNARDVVGLWVCLARFTQKILRYQDACVACATGVVLVISSLLTLGVYGQLAFVHADGVAQCASLHNVQMDPPDAFPHALGAFELWSAHGGVLWADVQRATRDGRPPTACHRAFPDVASELRDWSNNTYSDLMLDATSWPSRGVLELLPRGTCNTAIGVSCADLPVRCSAQDGNPFYTRIAQRVVRYERVYALLGLSLMNHSLSEAARVLARLNDNAPPALNATLHYLQLLEAADNHDLNAALWPLCTGAPTASAALASRTPRRATHGGPQTPLATMRPTNRSARSATYRGDRLASAPAAETPTEWLDWVAPRRGSAATAFGCNDVASDADLDAICDAKPIVDGVWAATDNRSVYSAVDWFGDVHPADRGGFYDAARQPVCLAHGAHVAPHAFKARNVTHDLLAVAADRRAAYEAYRATLGSRDNVRAAARGLCRAVHTWAARDARAAHLMGVQDPSGMLCVAFPGDDGAPAKLHDRNGEVESELTSSVLWDWIVGGSPYVNFYVPLVDGLPGAYAPYGDDNATVGLTCGAGPDDDDAWRDRRAAPCAQRVRSIAWVWYVWYCAAAVAVFGAFPTGLVLGYGVLRVLIGTPKSIVTVTQCLRRRCGGKPSKDKPWFGSPPEQTLTLLVVSAAGVVTWAFNQQLVGLLVDASYTRPLCGPAPGDDDGQDVDAARDVRWVHRPLWWSSQRTVDRPDMWVPLLTCPLVSIACIAVYLLFRKLLGSVLRMYERRGMANNVRERSNAVVDRPVVERPVVLTGRQRLRNAVVYAKQRLRQAMPNDTKKAKRNAFRVIAAFCVVAVGAIAAAQNVRLLRIVALLVARDDARDHVDGCGQSASEPRDAKSRLEAQTCVAEIATWSFEASWRAGLLAAVTMNRWAFRMPVLNRTFDCLRRCFGFKDTPLEPVGAVAQPLLLAERIPFVLVLLLACAAWHDAMRRVDVRAGVCANALSSDGGSLSLTDPIAMQRDEMLAIDKARDNMWRTDLDNSVEALVLSGVLVTIWAVFTFIDVVIEGCLGKQGDNPENTTENTTVDTSTNATLQTSRSNDVMAWSHMPLLSSLRHGSVVGDVMGRDAAAGECRPLLASATKSGV